MSAEPVVRDVRHLHRSEETEEEAEEDLDELEDREDLGSWPEDIDISVYADSSMTLPTICSV